MTNNKDFLYALVGEDKSVILPLELASRYGVRPGVRVHFREGPDGIYIRRPARLAKLYIEPTNRCNLNCSTCVRKAWDEPMGKMSDAVFARIIEGLREFSPPPTVFFGGFGEPLLHPKIISIVTEVKALGVKVELITNATLLTEDLSQELIRAGLDRLWVSLDGATPESYADVRLGAAFHQVLENLGHFRHAVYAEAYATDRHFLRKTRLGIVFVAIKRNISDLPEVINIGKRFGADRFLVTNVLPYTPEMIDEALYYRILSDDGHMHLSLPEMDADEVNYASIYQTLRNVYGSWAGINCKNIRNHCPFIENGMAAINWEGGLSPCLPLLHDHTSYRGHLRYNERFSRRWAVGNVVQSSLLDLWNAPEHIAFRERVQAFHFSPCIGCGGCNLCLNNEEDCFGNAFPTCGGCLWAQGVIQCP